MSCVAPTTRHNVGCAVNGRSPPASARNPPSWALPLGRKLIKLTVDLPAPDDGGPRRGHRRIGWVEWAVEPVRDRLTRSDYDDLVSSLALVIRWEPSSGCSTSVGCR